jgi:hypothetical protein
MLNQAFTEIRPNNMAVIINKCPNEFDRFEGLEFYKVCRQNLQSATILPVLTHDRILVLDRKVMNN